MPRAALSLQRESMPETVATFRDTESAEDTGRPLFKTKISPTRARVTGGGLFDRVHAQMGVAQLKGIELHPIPKIEWL